MLLSEVLLLWVPQAWSVFPPDTASTLQAADKSTTCSQKPLSTFACTLEAKLQSSVWSILLPCLQKELWKCSHAHLPTLPFFYCPLPVSFRCQNSPVFLPIYDYIFIYHNLVLALYSGISCFQMSLQFPCGQQYSWIKCCFLVCQDRRLLAPCPPQAVRDRLRNWEY